MQSRLIVFGLVFCCAGSLLTACGSAQKTSRASARRMAIPPGLDSATVRRSAKFADQNFVSAKREREAERLTQLGKERLQKVDEFWAYLEKKDQEAAPLSAEQQANFNLAFSEGARSLNNWKQLTRNGQDKKFSQAALNYCLEGQRYFEQALRVNPFDKNTRLLLATTYYNLQHLFGLEKNYVKAIEILERLVRLEKGEHALYRLLGDNYMEVKDFQAALASYRRAAQVMAETSFLAPPDSSTRFYYAYAEGDALARMHEGAAALNAFERARPLARTSQEKTDLQNYLKWVNWDGGNTLASEQWDKILALEAQKDYAQTASSCQKLLPAVKTLKARLAVAHKLAVMEFEYLERKDVAAERMQQVVEALPAGARDDPQDEDSKTYLNTYGAMLYRLGVEARKQEQKKLSLAYFTKAASFRWENVARAYLELVPLVWNSPDDAVKYGKLALASNNVLTREENCQLMSMMIKAHKSAGQFDEARTLFESWKNCQEASHAQN